MSGENEIKTDIKAERGGRIMNQPGFVLHTIRYKESSLIVDLFTRDYGRVSVIAKGAKRPASKLRAVLNSFQPLSLTWSGKSELKTLTMAEWLGGVPALEKSSLLYGFYLNELLMKLLAREDPHQTLYDRYVQTINELSEENSAPIVLRKFELALLKSMGVAGDLSVCTETEETVLSDESYVVDPEKGARPARVSDNAPIVSGKTLIDMMNENYTDAQTQTQSKILMRFLLGYHLGNAPIKTRQMLIDLTQL